MRAVIPGGCRMAAAKTTGSDMLSVMLLPILTYIKSATRQASTHAPSSNVLP